MGNDITITQKNPARRGIEIQNEGEIEATGVTIIDIVGTGHKVEKTGTNKVTIYSPIVDVVSYFNSEAGNNVALVDSIAIYNRYISAPDSEGTPFKIGDWSGGSLNPTTQLQTWTYTTTNQCLFDDLSSTIEVKVFDADDVSLLSTKLSGAITGNYTHTSNNIRISVTDWEPEGSKYKAVINVDVYTNIILPQGGRLSVRIIHHNTSGDYNKIQSPVFYDPNNVTATIGNITISETTPVLKYLSGVRYYTTGSQFSADVVQIDNLNNLSYPDQQVEVSGNIYGLSGFSLSGGDLTGWDNSYGDIGSSYQKLAWTIDIDNYSFIGDGYIQARPLDWIEGSWVQSTLSPILVNTKDLTSTRLIERFEEETWRCPLTGDFDLPNQKSWDSSIHNGFSDAVFVSGGVGRIITDFTAYNPDSLNQPNYSSQNASNLLIREFQHDGSPSSNFRLYISGTYTGIWYKIANEYTGSISDGTDWVNALSYYNFGDWNAGQPLNDTGGLLYDGGDYLDLTLGSNNLINALDNKTLYIMVEFTDSQFINQLSVVFN